MTDQLAGHEIARQEIAGHKNAGHERDGLKITAGREINCRRKSTVLSEITSQ